MSWTSTIPILVWAVIFLPVTVLLWYKKPEDKLTGILLLLAYLAFNLLCALVINWALINYWLRLLPGLFCILLVIRYFIHYRSYRSPLLPPKIPLRVGLLILSALIALGAGFLDIRTLLSLANPGDHVLLLYPVRNGLYVVVNGGNGQQGTGMNAWVNPWFDTGAPQDERMIYALDTVRMGIRGNLADGGILPARIQDYVGYNDMVYSPCFGQVVFVENGHRDPPAFTPGNPLLGNYVVIQCQEFFITLGNLRNNSIPVKEGDRVNVETLIGYVGNSGQPAIPHLHVHATRGGWKNGEGQPVLMLFDGTFSFTINRFYVRNDLGIHNK